MPQVFEFYFNPKLKPDLIFESFCYEPENIYERRVGSLYMVGLLKNVLPQNLRFLDRLAKVIKEEYYRSTLATPEKSLKKSLKEANEFLEGIAKKGDVSWLGNLSFGAISLRNFELNFTKAGELKFFLLRKGQVIDVDQKLKFEEIEPYPLKIFGSIVSGKLAENDIILALTKEVLEVFQGQDLIAKMAKIIPFDERKLREILNGKREELSKISGVCLLIFLSKEVIPGRHPPVALRETITPQLRPKEFSLKQVFTPIVNYFKGLIKKPKLEKLPKLKLPKITIPKVIIPKPKLTKNQIIILALIFFLALGFLIAQREEKQRLAIYQATLKEIQDKVDQAESFLILREVNPQAAKEANLLLKESWEEISPLVKIVPTLPSDFSSQVFSLKNKISENLYQLNELKIIEEPELLFEFKPGEFVPQKMVIFDNEIYFFSPYSQNLFKVSLKGEGQLIQINQKFNLARALDDSILFFLKSNQLINFKNNQFRETFSLELPYPDSDFNILSSYKSNLYFLDKKTGEIIKYPYLGNFKWDSPQLRLASPTKKAIEAKSMAIDGSIWLLNRDNSIGRYYAGRLQEIIKLDIFPYPKEFSKIFASPALPYLYLLEPAQNRIVIINKSGQIINQFQSQKFDNLLDFGVSENGKTIWLLNGLKVYKIQTTNH